MSAPAETLPPFSDPATWAPWHSRPVEIAVKDLLDIHVLLIAEKGHASGLFCPCRIAQKLRVALGGKAEALGSEIR